MILICGRGSRQWKQTYNNRNVTVMAWHYANLFEKFAKFIKQIDIANYE